LCMYEKVTAVRKSYQSKKNYHCEIKVTTVKSCICMKKLQL
jgi:hypothetical protein